MKFISTILFLLISVTSFSQDIVEFRGVSRSGTYNEKELLKEWPETGPELFLKIEGVGKGFSQPVFYNEEIFISGIKDDTIDILSAYNLKGEMLWETPYGRSWTNTYIDSRSTPTFENGKLFVVSGTGQLNCIDSKSGEIVWQVNVTKTYEGAIFKHGDAESPLIIGNSVLYTTGGEKNTLIALDKKDGSLSWKTKSLGGAKSYASPVLIRHNEKDFIIVQTSENIISIEPGTGEIMWSYNLIQYHLNRSGVGAQTNPPIYYNNELFATSGYNHPGIKFALSEDGRSAEVVWMNDTIDTHIGGVVLVDGNLYGSNWQSNSKGKWASVNWETGRTNWETAWNNKGSSVSADGMLYMYEEKRGNVALVEPSQDSLKIISTFKIEDGAGPHWSHPSIYDGKLFIRHGDFLMIYNIKDV